jgi:hypothetical protein
MKGKLAVLAAATFSVVAVSVAPAGAASSYGPGSYQTGPIRRPGRSRSSSATPVRPPP